MIWVLWCAQQAYRLPTRHRRHWFCLNIHLDLQLYTNQTFRECLHCFRCLPYLRFTVWTAHNYLCSPYECNELPFIRLYAWVVGESDDYNFSFIMLDLQAIATTFIVMFCQSQHRMVSTKNSFYYHSYWQKKTGFHALRAQSDIQKDTNIGNRVL